MTPIYSAFKINDYMHEYSNVNFEKDKTATFRFTFILKSFSVIKQPNIFLSWYKAISYYSLPEARTAVCRLQENSRILNTTACHIVCQ